MNRLVLLRPALLAVVALLPLACGPIDSTSGTGGTSGSGGGAGSTTCGTDTWANYGSAFFSSTCAGCHTQLSSQAFIQSDISQLSSAIAGGAMPYGGGLSSADRDRVVSYLNCGAP
jgi:hypothetical protein